MTKFLEQYKSSYNTLSTENKNLYNKLKKKRQNFLRRLVGENVYFFHVMLIEIDWFGNQLYYLQEEPI